MYSTSRHSFSDARKTNRSMGGYIKADYANRGDTSLRLFRGGLQSDLTTPKRPTNDRSWPKVSVKEVLNMAKSNVPNAPQTGRSEWSNWNRADVCFWPKAAVR